jgi:hypothetical protein
MPVGDTLLARRVPEKERWDRKQRELVLVKQQPRVRAVLDTVRETISNREELQSLEGLFKKLDADGDGHLSYEEFATGLRKLGCQITDEESRYLMDALDIDQDGKLQLEEFVSTMKAEFELTGDELSPGRESKEFEKIRRSTGFGNEGSGKWQEMCQEVVTAIHLGVRMTRTNSTAGLLTQQLDLAMVTEEAVEQRVRISKDPRVTIAFSMWWRDIQAHATKRVEKCEEWGGGFVSRVAGAATARQQQRQAERTLSKDQYIRMLVALSRHLNPAVDEEVAAEQAARDWELEKNRGGDYMDYSHFQRALFELVDTWVDSLGLDQVSSCSISRMLVHTFADLCLSLSTLGSQSILNKVPRFHSRVPASARRGDGG